MPPPRRQPPSKPKTAENPTYQTIRDPAVVLQAFENHVEAGQKVVAAEKGGLYFQLKKSTWEEQTKALILSCFRYPDFVLEQYEDRKRHLEPLHHMGQEYTDELAAEDLNAAVMAVQAAIIAPLRIDLTFAAEAKPLDAPENYSERDTQLPERSVFIVHGHDVQLRKEVELLLHKLDLNPIILKDAANLGRTLIEKLEQVAASAAYAVVIATPDDIGAASTQPTEVQLRARQNVVLELGWFCAKLSRARVCMLKKGTLELPTDYAGVIYINAEESDWEHQLAKELNQVWPGLPLDRI